MGNAEPKYRSGKVVDCIRGVTILPFVLRNNFPVRIRSRRTLAYALTLGGLYAMAEDKLIDSQTEPSLTHSLLVPILYGECVRVLHQLFPSTSCFWWYYDLFFRDYQIAEITDRVARNAMKPGKCYTIARGKSAPVKLALCGMAILSGNRNRIEKLLKSFDYWILGIQLYDDALDWREDYLSRRQTLVCTKIYQLIGSADNVQHRLSDIEKLVHSSDIMESVLSRSADCFAMAENCAKGIPCEDWIKLQRRFAWMTKEALRELVVYKAGILFGNQIKRFRSEYAF
jgi:hypothetical protein